MAVTTRITGLPQSPSFSARPETFDTDGENWMAAIDGATDEFNDMADEINETETAINAAAATAQQSATICQNVALALDNFAGSWVTLTGPLAEGSGVYHINLLWLSKVAIADITLNEPSASNTDWQCVSAFTFAIGADVASASTLALGVGANYFDVTGTTTITSITSDEILVKLHFDSALTLTHNATSLILPGGADIATSAGDEAEFFQYSSGNWRCVNFQRAANGPDGGGSYSSGTSTDLSGQSYIDIVLNPGKTTLITADSLSLSTSAVLQAEFRDSSSTVSGYCGTEGLTRSAGADVDREINSTVVKLTQLAATTATMYGLKIKAVDGKDVESSVYCSTSSGDGVCKTSGHHYGAWDRLRFKPASGTFASGTLIVKEM